MFEEENRGFRASVVLGITLTLSLVLLLVAGIVYSSWVPMVNLGAVVFMPAIVIIGDSLGGGDAYSFDEIRQAWRNMGSCFLGTVLISMIGLPLILLHNNTVNGEGFALWITSTFITAVGCIAFLIIRGRKSM